MPSDRGVSELVLFQRQRVIGGLEGARPSCRFCEVVVDEIQLLCNATVLAKPLERQREHVARGTKLLMFRASVEVFVYSIRQRR